MSNVIDTTNESAFQYSNITNPQINKICTPLNKHLGIPLFVYAKIFKDCSYLCLFNDYKCSNWRKYILTNIPDQGQLSSNTIRKNPCDCFFHTIWPRYPHNDTLFRPVYEYDVWHILCIHYKTKNYVENFYFGFDRGSDNKTDFFSENITALYKFIDHFRIHTQDLTDCTDKSKLAIYKNKFDLNLEGKLLDPEKEKRKQFIKDIKNGTLSNLNLSPREHRCMELLAQGRTMKEIGRMLSISPRTVESYIENVKDKTGCNFKSQIIDLYHNNKSWLDV